MKHACIRSKSISQKGGLTKSLNLRLHEVCRKSFLDLAHRPYTDRLFLLHRECVAKSSSQIIQICTSNARSFRFSTWSSNCRFNLRRCLLSPQIPVSGLQADFFLAKDQLAAGMHSGHVKCGLADFASDFVNAFTKSICLSGLSQWQGLDRWQYSGVYTGSKMRGSIGELFSNVIPHAEFALL